jgi:thiamine biosynthesis lipoprotein
MQRRRFIQLIATSAAGLGLGQLRATPTPTSLEPVRWSGYTLGAEGSFTLYTDNKAKAQTLLQHCFAEIRRLDSLFSLYAPHSQLNQLNRTGQLAQPSPEWQALLKSIQCAHQQTNGRFDPTVQALWQTYAAHFKQSPDDRTGPSAAAIEDTLARTGWQHVHYSNEAIRLARPNMQLTLNGIAQGFITDHISDILKDAGYQHVLVELGETRAIGSHPEQRPWRIGIKDANDPSTLHDLADLDNQALATSGSYGTRFSSDGNFHHLLDPYTGRPGTQWKSLSVIAPTATQADALSTGLSFASAAEIEAVQTAQPSIQVRTQSEPQTS